MPSGKMVGGHLSHIHCPSMSASLPSWLRNARARAVPKVHWCVAPPPPPPPPSTHTHKKTLKLNVHIVLNISWKFHSCVKTLTYKNKKLIKKCLVPMPGRPRAVPEVPTRVAHARYAQKTLKFNVQIVLNTSSMFRSSMNILTCKMK